MSSLSSSYVTVTSYIISFPPLILSSLTLLYPNSLFSFYPLSLLFLFISIHRSQPYPILFPYSTLHCTKYNHFFPSFLLSFFLSSFPLFFLFFFPSFFLPFFLSKSHSAFKSYQLASLVWVIRGSVYQWRCSELIIRVPYHSSFLILPGTDLLMRFLVFYCFEFCTLVDGLYSLLLFIVFSYTSFAKCFKP